MNVGGRRREEGCEDRREKEGKDRGGRVVIGGMSHHSLSLTPSPSLPPPHTLFLTLTPFPSLPLPHSLPLTPSPSHPLPHTLSLTPSPSLPLPHSLSLTPSPSHPLLYSIPLPHTLSFTPSPSHLLTPSPSHPGIPPHLSHGECTRRQWYARRQLVR